MNVISSLIRACPPFYQTLVGTAERWLKEDGNISSCAVLSILSSFVIERLRQYEYDHMTEIFAMAEEFLVSGSQELKDATATCFLENLLNATPERLNATSFVPLLGPVSQDYCHAWDTFTGVKTPGIR